MDDLEVDELVEILNIPANRRSHAQLQLIFDRLRTIESLSSVRDQELKKACEKSKYRFADANTILYRKNEPIEEWFVLLSGSVFINGSMFFPVTSFGHQQGLGNPNDRRTTQCLVLEPSDILMVDLRGVVKPGSGTKTTEKANPQAISVPQYQQYQQQSLDSNYFSSDSIGTRANTKSQTSNSSSSTAAASPHVPYPLPPKQIGGGQPVYTKPIGSQSPSNLAAPHVYISQQIGSSAANTQNTQNTLNQYQTTNNNNNNNSNVNTSSNGQNVNNNSSNNSNQPSNLSLTNNNNHPPASSYHNIHPSSHFAQQHHIAQVQLAAVQQKRVSTSSSDTNNVTQHQHQQQQNQVIYATPNNQPSVPSQNYQTQNSYNYSPNLIPRGMGLDAHNRNNSLISSSSNQSCQFYNRDNVKEVFEKDPAERNEDDIDILADYTKTLPAFMNLTDPVRKKLCSHMVFVQIDLSGTLVLGDQEELDSWSVILNGEVKVTYDDGVNFKELGFGAAFGVRPTLDRQVHQGRMVTLCNDCQFVCIAQKDYYDVLHESQDAQHRVLDPMTGKVCMIKECRNEEQLQTNQINRKKSERKAAKLNDHSKNVDQKNMDSMSGNTTVSNDKHQIASTAWSSATVQERAGEKLDRSQSEVSSQTDSSIPDDDSKKDDYVVIRGTPNALLDHLMDHNPKSDATFIEDFLLTCRVFYPEMPKICAKLLHWMEQPAYRHKVVQIMFHWVNQHFTSDFDQNEHMLNVLEQFESLLGKYGNKSMQLSEMSTCSSINSDELFFTKSNPQQQILHLLVHHQAKQRKVILKRELTAQRELPFNILGGDEVGYPLFVSHVPAATQLLAPGLKRGDQLVEVNGRSLVTVSDEVDQVSGYRVCKSTSMADATELLRRNTHLNLTVKTNPFGFKYMMKELKNPQAQEIQEKLDRQKNQLLEENEKAKQVEDVQKVKSKASPKFKRTKSFRRAGAKLVKVMNKIVVQHSSSSLANESDRQFFKSQMRQRHTRLIGLPTVVAENENVVDNLLKDESDKLQEDIIRVFRADQTSKYVPITKATTAREALKLALHFFEGNEKRHEDYTLSMVTVNLGDVVKVSRLPDQLCNLAERLPLSGRFYIKSLNESEQLLPDESVPILSQQANVSFLDLSAETVAKSVTTRDYKIFQTIPQTAYIEPMLESFSLELKSGEENKAILEFERLNNSEMFWVVWAILQEPKPERRAKVIKHFLQVARTLHALKNLNSLFNVIFGLAHISVKRLKRTWELVPKKWIQLFEEFEGLQDPSRNMSRYRSLLNDSKKNPPLIPFFPIVRKDFIFLHYGNDTKVEDLINFEKMRMVAKSVRDICRMVDPNGLHEDEYSRTVNEPNKLSTQSTEHSGFDVITEQFSTLGRKKHPKPAHITSEVSEAYGINQESNISVDTGVNANQMRKIYDDLLMSRRVKQYLKCLETDIITDEIKLSELSKELEPPLAPASELVSRRNKMNNVDSVSITSSQSMQSTEALLVKNGKSHSRQDSAPVSMSRGDIVKLDAGNNKQDLGAESEDNLSKLLSLSENKNTGPLREPSPVILLKYNNPSSPKNDPKKALGLAAGSVIKPSQSQNSLNSNTNDPTFQRGTILTSSRRSATSLSSLGSNSAQPSTLSLVKPNLKPHQHGHHSTPSPSSSTSNTTTNKIRSKHKDRNLDKTVKISEHPPSHQPYPENPIFVPPKAPLPQKHRQNTPPNSNNNGPTSSGALRKRQPASIKARNARSRDEYACPSDIRVDRDNMQPIIIPHHYQNVQNTSMMENGQHNTYHVLHDPFLAERTKSRDPNRSRVVKNMRAQSSSSKVEGRREERRRKHPHTDRVIHERREERHDRTDKTHERTNGGAHGAHERSNFHHHQFQQITLNNKTTSSSSAVSVPTGTGNLPRGQKSKSSSSKHSFQQSSSSQQVPQSSSSLNERGIDVGASSRQSNIRETSQSQSNNSSTPVDNRIDFV